MRIRGVKPTVFVQLFLSFVSYTIVLIGLLYLAQRFLAPTLYLNAVVDEDRQDLASLSEFYTEEQTSDALEERALQINGEVSIYDARGNVLYDDTSDGALRSIDVVRIFQGELTQQIVTSDQSYLEVYVVDSSTIFRLKTPFAPLVNNIALLNQFFYLLIGVAALLVGPISWAFARSFTRPIRQLTTLAESFANLDFDAFELSPRSDEIGTLATTLKTMSTRLSDTIKELETELAKEKALDRLQKNFIARVSHEIKTPLSIMQAALEAMSHGANPERDYAGMIQEEITRLSELTDDLIDLTQLESGRFNVNRSEVELGPILLSIVNSYDAIAQRPIQYTGESFTVSGDAKRLTQVFRNLLKNALEHSDVPGLIVITSDPIARSVTIENPHSKISEATLKQWGSPFYKPDEKTKGHGLGLAISRQLLKLHEATLTVNYTDKVVVKVKF